MSESDIQTQIRLALGMDPRVVLWRNNVGVARIGGREIRFGLCPGSADLIGICNGRFFALEVKTPTGRLSKAQRDWHALVTARGGFVRVVRSVEDARKAVEECVDD